MRVVETVEIKGGDVTHLALARARIPVEFYLDEDLGTWHLHVDEPRTTGGGQTTVDAGRSAAAKAIAFALEGDGKAQHGGRVEYLEVAVG